ncbi:MAG: sodium:solute symporter family protein [Prolixibacteraceae bacterium]|nr:sodium:solute symporter family protein [Prolixibacteraceae bacterium]MBN2649144.1 sodium:solute symporter family protein [Prolixibacteraceae bacterium]
MHFIDYVIFIIYMAAMLLFGFYFMRRNKTVDDYFVGSRNMNHWHIGLSVVATDVGGGFSIGLGGLGFVMGLSGSWLLFTGLVGAWLAGVFLVPVISRYSKSHNLLSFPQFLEIKYNKRVSFIAGIVSAIGYLGFTSSQLLAGAKLASTVVPDLTNTIALVVMGVVAVVYTFAGGIKAVIYTDTIQWIVLLAGLIFIGIPFSYAEFGGLEASKNLLPDHFFSLTNVTWQQLLNWGITIIPIWFIGMTLYQRIYASRDEKTAKKAWFIAGLFEYPVMAFSGVILGLYARLAFIEGYFPAYPDINAFDPEIGVPMLLKTILPAGLTGVILAVYFSAIMSTSDSCLMASSGNFQTDIFKINPKNPKAIKISQLFTFLIGAVAVVIALKIPNVLELMLLSYAFMVSGLFIPVLAALFIKKLNSTAAIASMIAGGGTTLTLIILNATLPYGLDANVFGVSASLVAFVVVSALAKNRHLQ